MDKKGKLQLATQSLLDEIEGILRRAAGSYPQLDGPARVLGQVSKAASRPLRIGILGEPGSGKSSLANLLVGVPVLPAPSLANARIPALLKYAPEPTFAAIYQSGERITFPLLQDVAQAVAIIQDRIAKCSVPPGGLKTLEVGLPSSILRSFEILDLPADYPGSPDLRLDAAIWTVAAARAWHEPEQAQWAGLPQPVRSRSLLAVTFCDLAKGGDNDLERLQARLEVAAKPHFQGTCFVKNGESDLAAASARNTVLFTQIQSLAYQFAAERFSKAMSIAHRAMAKPAAKPSLAAGTKRNGFSSHAVAGAGKDLFDRDRLIILKQPLPEDAPAKPAILRNGHASAAMVETAARQTALENRSPAAGERSRRRSHWMAVGLSAAVAGIVTLVAIQPGLIGTGRNLASNPLPGASVAVEQAALEKAGTRRKAEAEAAEAGVHAGVRAETVAAGERGQAQVETAAAETRQKAMADGEREPTQAETAQTEERGQAQAEAAAAEARQKAVAEVVAAWKRRAAQAEAGRAEARLDSLTEAVEVPRRRKKADARPRHRWAEPADGERRRRTMAEAVLHQFGGSGPIMHGVSQ